LSEKFYPVIEIWKGYKQSVILTGSLDN